LKDKSKEILMKTILCYGDSNTWGCPPIVRWPITSLERYDAGIRWGSVLRTLLGDEYCVIEEGLNARTTVWDDPVEGEFRNGKSYLLPCLKSHAPIDLVALMLGTNDLKSRFGLSASDIAGGVGALVDIIRTSATGPDNAPPLVLVMCPPPVAGLTIFADIFAGAGPKSLSLQKHYLKVAQDHGCAFLAVGDLIRSSDRDGIHFEPADQQKLGRAVADCVRRMIRESA
jgi:lysophospholipase L1-like esterase